MVLLRQALKGAAHRIIGVFGLVILIGMLLPGCDLKSEDAPLQKKKPIVSKRNTQHNLAVEFYGELIGPDGEPPDQLLVDHILIRDLKTMRSERFMPKDAETLQSSFGYFTDVWSPDGAYLALPLGRFDGFVLFSSQTVFEDLKQGRFSETIRIGLAAENSPRLWHEFIGWQKSHLLQFSAGLSGKQTGFVFDPTTGEAYAQTASAGSFKAINKSGTCEVKKQ